MLLKTEAKRVRAEVIARHVEAAGYPGVVCFSCGNASAALKVLGLRVVDVSPTGGLEARRWWTPAEIRCTFPQLFDATSGHLPIPVMVDVARALRAAVGDLPAGTYHVPSGSGETALCLRWAYGPDVVLVAQYDDAQHATRWEQQAPLNHVVAASMPVVRLPLR